MMDFRFRSGGSLLLSSFLLTGGLFLAGCGGGVETVPTSAVSGEVNLDGAPLKEGTITFYPEQDATGNPLKGQMIQARISDGKYTIANPPGVTVGKNKVAVSATKIVGTEKKDGVDIEKREEILPAKYNADTTLSLDVTSSGTTGNFDLQSK